MPTYRKSLDILMRKTSSAAYVTCAALFSSLALAWYLENSFGRTAALFAFIPLLLALIIYLRCWQRLRCPACSKSLINILGSNPGFKIPQFIKYCPYCGISFDLPSTTQPIGAADRKVRGR
jgi:hypothetical protein